MYDVMRNSLRTPIYHFLLLEAHTDGELNGRTDTCQESCTVSDPMRFSCTVCDMHSFLAAGRFCVTSKNGQTLPKIDLEESSSRTGKGEDHVIHSCWLIVLIFDGEIWF